jgi:cysteine-S-conjugate beta-lyase
MKYDFNKVIDRRNTDSLKWNCFPQVFEQDDILPMWVADMDFPVAKPIVDAIQKRAAHAFYGYNQPGPSLVEAVVERTLRKFNWKIKPEWIVFTPGVIPALNAAVKAFTCPGDEVILQGPVYYPFWSAVALNGCQAVNNGLILVDGHYVMDYSDLERKFAPHIGMQPGSNRVKTLIFCNPHNPVGRVWTKEEITRMGEIVIGHGGMVISDEIHCELLFKGFKHICFAAISREFEQNCMVCMAPSKTFNLAGLQCSSVIIPNDKLRQRFANARAGIQLRPNIFGITAMEAAYRYGDEWLDQVHDYLQANLEYLMDYFVKNIKKVGVIKPEGTYLVWLDCRALGMDNMTLREFMREKAKVGVDDGFLFGPGGEGFARINIACPRTILEEGLQRIAAAVKTL